MTYLVGIRIGQAHAQDGRELHSRICAAASVKKQGKCRVILMRNPCAGQAHSQCSAPHYVGVFAVLVLIHLRETPLNVPEGDQSNAGCSGNLGMIFVLEDPVNLQTNPNP